MDFGFGSIQGLWNEHKINSGDRKECFARIVAHLGASGIAPENTLPAFREALSLGVQEVEFDLWATADRRVVVFHDSTLDRLTTGSGAINERT